VVTFTDPPPTLSGMINVQLDPDGHLLFFQAIPPEKEATPHPSRPAEWLPLFSAAGLNPADFHSVEPIWDSLAAPDIRAAWDGAWPGSSRPLHIEAAARRGKPVFFSLTGPWTKATRMIQPDNTSSNKASRIIGLSIALVIFGGGVLLAHRNNSRGKGDRQGALRLATLVFALELSVCLFRSHFVLTFGTIGIIFFAIGTGLFVSGLMWTLYLALEPYVRRLWPQTIISWTRLVSGRLRDPLVGRDLLYGVLLGIAWDLVFVIGNFFEIRAGAQPPLANSEILQGSRETVAICLINVVSSIRTTLVFFFLIVLLRILVKNRWLAATIFTLLFAVPRTLGSDHLLIDGVVALLIYGIAAIAVVRFGLIVLAVGVLTADVLANLPFTLDFSNWYAARVLGLVLGFVLIAAWGFYTSLGDQRLWKEELFE